VTSAAFDVVVVGAGPAGLATAIALRRLGEASVLVADARLPGQPGAGETAAPDLLIALGRLGLVERFLAGGHSPCPGSASIWGSDRVGFNDVVLSPVGPGWRLDRGAFDRMLADAAAEKGAVLHWHTRFVGRASTEDERHPHVVHFSSGGCGVFSVGARYIVDATGPGAFVARAGGVGRRVDDRLFALIGLGAVASSTSTWQTLTEAVRDGWWYAARVRDDQAVVMFVTDLPGLRRLRAGGETAFFAALEATSLVGSIIATGRHREHKPAETPGLRVLPIVSSVLDTINAAGMIAVGDAVASFDPIVGQGISKAIASGTAAAQPVYASVTGERWASGRRAADNEVAGYRRNRAHIYASERRFPGARFWEQRRTRSAQALEGSEL
jgi:flavin-dependent dehydrogenase